MSSRRVKITLDEAHAMRLDDAARRCNVPAATLASSLVATALDAAPPSAGYLTELLDSVPGAFERTEKSLRQACSGLGISLDEL